MVKNPAPGGVNNVSVLQKWNFFNRRVTKGVLNSNFFKQAIKVLNKQVCNLSPFFVGRVFYKGLGHKIIACQWSLIPNSNSWKGINGQIYRRCEAGI